MKLIKIVLTIFLFLYIKKAIGISYQWLQIVHEDQIWLRYIDDQIIECPKVSIDGQAVQMGIFSQKTDDFPLNCRLSFDIKNLPKKVLLNQEEVKINFSKNNIKKIAVLGDTGCRIHKFIKQDCQNNWPFKQIANAIAENNPDLVIHVGDYIYRENGYQDNWKTWEEDFFKPASELLKKNIPFILVRGNHEDCSRNGNGWFRLLSQSNQQCEDYSPMYSIDINRIKFIITDSTLDEKLMHDVRQINSQPLGKHQYWILTHRPLVFYDGNNSITGYHKLFSSLDDRIKMVISGHIHALQIVREEHRIQLISGNGGTLLTSYLGNKDTKVDYGFAMIDFNGYQITITGYNKENKKILKKIL